MLKMNDNFSEHLIEKRGSSNISFCSISQFPCELFCLMEILRLGRAALHGAVRLRKAGYMAFVFPAHPPFYYICWTDIYPLFAPSVHALRALFECMVLGQAPRCDRHTLLQLGGADVRCLVTPFLGSCVPATHIQTKKHKLAD